MCFNSKKCGSRKFFYCKRRKILFYICKKNKQQIVIKQRQAKSYLFYGFGENKIIKNFKINEITWNNEKYENEFSQRQLKDFLVAREQEVEAKKAAKRKQIQEKREAGKKRKLVESEESETIEHEKEVVIMENKNQKEEIETVEQSKEKKNQEKKKEKQIN